MEKIKNHLDYITSLEQAISSESLAELDFDRLCHWLKEMAAILGQTDSINTDLNLLRDDYLARISGIVKAIAAVSSNPDHLEEALAYIERLSGFDAASLIREYRLVSARFRDAFPASFGNNPVMN